MATLPKYFPMLKRDNREEKLRKDLTSGGRRSSIGVLKMKNLKTVKKADPKKIDFKLSTVAILSNYSLTNSLKSESNSSIKTDDRNITAPLKTNGSNTRAARYDRSKRPEVLVKASVSVASRQSKKPTVKEVNFVERPSDTGDPKTVKSRYIRRTTALRKLPRNYHTIDERDSTTSIESVKASLKIDLASRKSEVQSRRSHFSDSNSLSKREEASKKVQYVQSDVGKDERSPRKIERRQTGLYIPFKILDPDTAIDAEKKKRGKRQTKPTDRRSASTSTVSAGPKPTRKQSKLGKDKRGNSSSDGLFKNSMQFGSNDASIPPKKLTFIAPHRNRSASLSSVGEAIKNRRQTGMFQGPLLGQTFDLDEDKDDEDDDSKTDTEKSKDTKTRSSILYSADSILTTRNRQEQPKKERKSCLKKHSIVNRISFKKKNVTFDPQMPPSKTSHAYFQALRKSNDRNEFGLTRQLNTSKFVSCWEAMSYRNSYLKTYHKPVQKKPIVEINNYT